MTGVADAAPPTALPWRARDPARGIARRTTRVADIRFPVRVHGYPVGPWCDAVEG